jgi:thiol-disulfide isomerase/thioredoxin
MTQREFASLIGFSFVLAFTFSTAATPRASSAGLHSLRKESASVEGRGFNPAVSGPVSSGVLTPEALARIFPHPLQSGPNADAMEILHRTAAAYRQLKSYEFHVTVQTVRGSEVTERRFRESGMGGMFRIEEDGAHGELRVSDGRTEWTLNREKNEYAKVSLTEGAATPMSDFADIDQHVAQATIAREELFTSHGNTARLYVVAVVRDRWPAGTFPGAQLVMYHIDEQTFRVRETVTHSSDAAEISIYSDEQWNEPLTAAEFTFVPPAGDQEAKSASSSVPRAVNLVGTIAPDFTLQTVDGRSLNLASFRGKVVVADFWASWCPPCQAEMPFLEKMQTVFGPRGLVVLGLDVGEDAPTVVQFQKQALSTFPLLIGAEPDVAGKYYVEALPTTYVIDRQGRIVFHETGFGQVRELVSAVQQALGSGK